MTNLPWLFLQLDLLYDYWIGLIVMEFLLVKLWTGIFYRGAPRYTSDCRGGAWCHLYIYIYVCVCALFMSQLVFVLLYYWLL